MLDDTYKKLKNIVQVKGTATPELLRAYVDETKARDSRKDLVAKAHKEALQVAKDFEYPSDVVNAINECNSVEGINRIMKNAKAYI